MHVVEALSVTSPQGHDSIFFYLSGLVNTFMKSLKALNRSQLLRLNISVSFAVSVTNLLVVYIRSANSAIIVSSVTALRNMLFITKQGYDQTAKFI